MRLSDLFALPEFSEFSLIAGGQNGGRVITSVNVIDSPDSYLYFKGGEFLLTNTYIMRNDTGILLDLIRSCSRIGVAAIGLKIGRFMEEVPAACIELANELDFPLVSIPLRFAFVDIINRVLLEINDLQDRQLRFSETVHTAFTNLTLQGGETEEILDSLAEILHRPVLYWDTYFECLHRSGAAEPIPIREAPAPLEVLLRRYTHFVQQVDSITYGYLILTGDDPETEDERANTRIAAQHAGTVLKLNTQKKISNVQIASRHRDEFVQDLFLGRFSSLEQIHSRARAYNWHFQGDVTAVAMEFAAEGPDQNLRNIDYMIAKKVRQRYRASMYTKLGDQMVFLIERAEADGDFLPRLQAFCRELLGELRLQYGVEARIGIGQLRSSLLEAPQSYLEAQKAVSVGAAVGLEAALYTELGLFRLLQSCDSACAAEYLAHYIQPLRRWDEARRTEYLQTLCCLIACDWNLQDTAKQMYLHYNTVKNRYRRIGELLGVDLGRGEIRVELTVACKLMLLQ